jgi:hypothetical protein
MHMDRVRAFLVIGTVFFLAATQAIAAEPPFTGPVFIQSSVDASNGAPKIVSRVNGAGEPVPGELIVKYRSSVGSVTQRIQAARTVAVPSHPLDRLHKDLGAMSAS